MRLECRHIDDVCSETLQKVDVVLSQLHNEKNCMGVMGGCPEFLLRSRLMPQVSPCLVVAALD